MFRYRGTEVGGLPVPGYRVEPTGRGWAPVTVRLSRSAADGAVDLFTEDVGMAGMSAGFFDQVHQGPPHRGARSPAGWARGGPGEVRAGFDDPVRLFVGVPVGAEQAVEGLVRVG